MAISQVSYCHSVSQAFIRHSSEFISPDEVRATSDESLKQVAEDQVASLLKNLQGRNASSQERCWYHYWGLNTHCTTLFVFPCPSFSWEGKICTFCFNILMGIPMKYQLQVLCLWYKLFAIHTPYRLCLAQQPLWKKSNQCELVNLTICLRLI